MKHDLFSRTDLSAPDPAAAKAFYSALFEWGCREMGPLPPHWMVYFAVADVDQSATAATELGGRVVVPPTDIGVGRFAVLADDQGAAFTIFRGNS